jgi:hypothetical protein
MRQSPFLPVPVSPRFDGWTPQRQWAFIKALADTGSATEAAQIAGKSVRSAQKLRRHPLALAPPLPKKGTAKPVEFQ